MSATILDLEEIKAHKIVDHEEDKILDEAIEGICVAYEAGLLRSQQLRDCVRGYVRESLYRRKARNAS